MIFRLPHLKKLFFIFFVFIIGCEIPHSNNEENIAECNVYNDYLDEVIFCPNIAGSGFFMEVNQDKNFTIKFLDNREPQLFEVYNSLLKIGEVQKDENNLSIVQISPKIVGTTFLKILSDNYEVDITIQVNSKNLIYPY
jgi:hypothetical protein